MRKTMTDRREDLQSPTALAGVLGETRIYLHDVPNHIPTSPTGRKTHYSTVLRWAMRGVHGVRLEAVRLGGRWVTSLEAVSRFSAGVTATTAPMPSSPAIDQRRADQVDQELDAAGIV